MTDTTAVAVRYARIVTPTTTYVKYAFQVDPDGVATVRHPRETVNERKLTDVVVKAGMDGVWDLYELVGRNENDEWEGWRVDNLGCGCRDSIRTYATEGTPT